MLIPVKNTLSFAIADANKSCTFYENGFIKSIVLVLPNFTTATSATQIDVIDDDSYTIYTNTTGWLENATHLITGISVPVGKAYTLKVTLNAGAGGAHDAVVKVFINTQE